MERAETSCKEKCAIFQDVKAKQQSATHAQTGCCTSFSSHGAGHKVNHSIYMNSPREFLEQRREGCLVFYSLVTLVTWITRCNCLILVSERVSGLTGFFSSIKTFILYILLSLSHKSTTGVSHLCLSHISTTPASFCTPCSCAPSGLFETSQQVQRSYEV